MSIASYLKIILYPALLFIFHLFATFVFNIYNHAKWFDWPMHFAGGICIAISAYFYLSIRQKQGALQNRSKLDTLIFIVGTVALAATCWEILEYLGDTFVYRQAYFQSSQFDSMKDMFLGLTGGTLTALIAINLRNKE